MDTSLTASEAQKIWLLSTAAVFAQLLVWPEFVEHLAKELGKALDGGEKSAGLEPLVLTVLLAELNQTDPNRVMYGRRLFEEWKSSAEGGLSDDGPATPFLDLQTRSIGFVDINDWRAFTGRIVGTSAKSIDEALAHGDLTRGPNRDVPSPHEGVMETDPKKEANKQLFCAAVAAGAREIPGVGPVMGLGIDLACQWAMDEYSESFVPKGPSLPEYDESKEKPTTLPVYDETKKMPLEDSGGQKVLNWREVRRKMGAAPLDYDEFRETVGTSERPRRRVSGDIDPSQDVTVYRDPKTIVNISPADPPKGLPGEHLVLIPTPVPSAAPITQRMVAGAERYVVAEIPQLESTTSRGPLGAIATVWHGTRRILGRVFGGSR